MKTPNKQEFQQITFNHSADIEFVKTLWITHYFLLIDTTLASDNPFHFRKDLLKRIQKLIMIIDDKINDEKLQYDINAEAAKISALSSGKINKYKYAKFRGKKSFRNKKQKQMEVKVRSN